MLPKTLRNWYKQQKNEHFLQLICSGIYRQLYKFFLKPYCVGKFSAWKISKNQTANFLLKSNIQVCRTITSDGIIFPFQGFCLKYLQSSFNSFFFSSLSKIWVFVDCNRESWVVNEFTNLAALLRNYQPTTFKVNSKCQFSKIAEPQAFLNLLVFLFRFSLFRGTEIIVNDKILRDALQKDRFSNFKIKWFVTLNCKMIFSRNKLYQMLIVDRGLIFYLTLHYLC